MYPIAQDGIIVQYFFACSDVPHAKKWYFTYCPLARKNRSEISNKFSYLQRYSILSSLVSHSNASIVLRPVSSNIKMNGADKLFQNEIAGGSITCSLKLLGFFIQARKLLVLLKCVSRKTMLSKLCSNFENTFCFKRVKIHNFAVMIYVTKIFVGNWKNYKISWNSFTPSTTKLFSKSVGATTELMSTVIRRKQAFFIKMRPIISIIY